MPKPRHDLQKILDEAETCSDDDRAFLAEELLAGLRPPRQASSSASEWLGEVERRARAAVAGSPGLPWEAVHAQIQNRLARLEGGH